MSLAETLGVFARDVRVPDDVRADVRRRVLDTVGVALAALPLDTSRAAIAMTTEQGGAPQARAIGVTEPLPAPSAAFVNGVLAHSLDYDDTHLPSILHPSASVIPAALAAAESAMAPGSAFVRAAAVGLEVCVRLGMAGYDPVSRDSRYFERGQHATSMCGAIGSAAAAATLLGADAAHAMAIAVSMASGVIEGNRAGGTVKRIHCGWAAQSGVTAALLARSGFTGPPTALEGRFGFFQAFIDGRFDASAITEGLGSRWDSSRTFVKPYPANHFTHAGIDAAMELRAAGVRPDDVESIDLGVAAPTVRTIGEPIEAKRAPETGYQAQFSGPYTVAAALIGGGGLGLGLDDFTDALARESVRSALAARVSVHADADCGAIYPMQLPAVLRVRTRDGRALEARVLNNRGGPERPLSEDELTAKFTDNALRVVRLDVAEQIAERIAKLDTLEHAGDVLVPATCLVKGE